MPFLYDYGLNLKELYTSETILAQKIVLTPLNNEFKLKIWKYDLLHAKKSANIFEKKSTKSVFSLSEGSNGFHS